MAKRLTTAAVRSLKPGRSRREVPDAAVPGLRLIVQPTGKKVWALRLRRPSGRTAKVTLGLADTAGQEAAAAPVVGQLLSLPAARQLAASLLRDKAMGIDVAAAVVHQKRRARGERDAAAAGTFAVAAADYAAHARKSLRGWKRTARVLGLDEQLRVVRGGLADRWSARPVAEVTSGDVYGVVDEARHRGVPGMPRRAEGPTEGMARAMHDTLSALFAWCYRHRRVESNPCASVHPPEPPGERDRVLSDSELAALWKAADGISWRFGAIFKLLALTGARLREVAEMRWSELSDDGATLHLPAARTKSKRPHDVPLSALAQAVVASVPRVAGSDFVFTVDGSAPVRGFARAKASIDALMPPGTAPFVTHDVRRSVATGLQRLGVELPVVEKILGHESGSFRGVVKIYQRHKYEDEQRAALERWAAHVESLVR